MITGNILRDAIISGANNIANNRMRVDQLNVFPVPDGDTGTNMSLSIANASKELQRMNDKTVTEVADAAASALLRGARGNSGVILSLLFRGISKGFKGKETADAADLAVALRAGVDAAYKAVMKPTEGTILTVSKDAATAAEAAAKEGKDIVSTFETAVEAAKVSLANTPELLPVLKKAGVVDAGGQGYVVIFEGMLSVLKTGTIVTSSNVVEEEPEEIDTSAFDVWDEDFTYFYCTEFIVNKTEDCGDPLLLRAYLESIGDSVVVVDDDDIIKVHVHTDNPGNALQEGLKFGSLCKMKIENMFEQHEEAKRNTGASKKKKSSAGYEIAPQDNEYGFVSVAAGDGIQELFKELGCDMIVSGGQTMNPSTDDILAAIEQTPAKTVFVLPNNKNIIMAAEQTITLATRKVIVLQTRSIPMGIAAMISFDADADADKNAIAMTKAADHVGTGQITFAARDSDYDGHKIKEGEILAIENGKVAFVEQDLIKSVAKLTKNLYKKDSQFITIIYGSDVSEEQAELAKQAVEAKVGTSAEIALIPGGQPVYYFIISVE